MGVGETAGLCLVKNPVGRWKIAELPVPKGRRDVRPPSDVGFGPTVKGLEGVSPSTMAPLSFGAFVGSANTVVVSVEVTVTAAGVTVTVTGAAQPSPPGLPARLLGVPPVTLSAMGEPLAPVGAGWMVTVLVVVDVWERVVVLSSAGEP